MAKAIRMMLTGDTMLSQGLTAHQEPEYLALADLMREADIAFTNLETVVRKDGEGQAAFTLGTPMTTPPDLLGDLGWMGVGIASAANNHASDYGVAGVVAMTKHLKRAKLPFAGIGNDLKSARAPAYAKTKAGKVALIAATSFFRAGDQASDSRPDAPGRPGINPLRFARSFTVDEATFSTLARMGAELGLAQEAARHRAHFFSASEAPADSAEKLYLLGANFTRGTTPALETKAHTGDEKAILDSIREARQKADWVIVSFHNHEFGGEARLTAKKDTEMEEPAEFAVRLARAAIDAGADVVAGHGPHLTLGIEIYRGRPIFYSLGNFILQNDTIASIPAESYARFGLGADAKPDDFFDARTAKDTRGFPASAEYWESFAAECVFEEGRLNAITLHPLDLGHGLPRADRGRPKLAHGDKAKAALERVQRLSRRYETDIVIEGDVGIVRL